MTTPAELRAQIDVKGAEISLLADQIETRFHELKDWRRNVESAPLRAVGLAVGVGLLASGIGFPVLCLIGREAGFAARASVTAYLTTIFTDKLHQFAER
jgi:hypothetical protein